MSTPVEQPMDADATYALRASQLQVLSMEQQRVLRAQFDPQQALSWLELAAPKELPGCLTGADGTNESSAKAQSL